MSIDQSTVVDGGVAAPGAFRRFLRNPLGMTGTILLAAVVLMSVFAPVLAPHSPRTPQLSMVNAGPDAVYLLGGDTAGRDILSRLIWGGQSTLVGALIVLVVATVVGVGTGLVAAYVGRFVDTTLTWVSETLLAIPSLIVLIALYAVMGPNLTVSMTVFGVLVSPFLYRLVRSLALQVKHEAYVEAAQVSGVSAPRILGRHVLGVIRGPVIVMMADVAATGIGIQASMEFLGFGDANTVTWGGMVQDAFTALYLAPLSVVWPGLLLTVVIGSLTLIGNAIRDSLVPGTAPLRRSRRRRAADATAGVETGAVASATSTTASADAGALSAGGEALLRVRDLRIAYPRADGTLGDVVASVSFDVRPGEVLGIVGESGSGKSQTVFSILDLLPRTAQVLDGELTIDGRRLDRAHLRELRGRRIGYVPQEPMVNLDPSFTIGHQMTRPLQKLMGLSRRAARTRAVELLDSVGIRDPERVMSLYPHQVSGGMAQRVLIAGAVSCEPELLIADEPTTALDVTVQFEILELLRQQQARGLAIVLVTHNFGVVADICDRVVVMRHGRIVEAGPFADVYRDPQHEYTRALLAATLEDAPYRRPLAEIGAGA